MGHLTRNKLKYFFLFDLQDTQSDIKHILVLQELIS